MKTLFFLLPKTTWTGIFRKSGRSIWVAARFALGFLTKESGGNVLWGGTRYMLTISFAVFVAYDFSRRRKRHFDLFVTCLAGIIIYIPGRLFGRFYESVPLFCSLQLVWILP